MGGRPAIICCDVSSVSCEGWRLGGMDKSVVRCWWCCWWRQRFPFREAKIETLDSEFVNWHEYRWKEQSLLERSSREVQVIEVNSAGALQEARGLVILHRIDIKLFPASKNKGQGTNWKTSSKGRQIITKKHTGQPVSFHAKDYLSNYKTSPVQMR